MHCSTLARDLFHLSMTTVRGVSYDDAAPSPPSQDPSCIKPFHSPPLGFSPTDSTMMQASRSEQSFDFSSPSPIDGGFAKTPLSSSPGQLTFQAPTPLTSYDGLQISMPQDDISSRIPLVNGIDSFEQRPSYQQGAFLEQDSSHIGYQAFQRYEQHQQEHQANATGVYPEEGPTNDSPFIDALFGFEECEGTESGFGTTPSISPATTPSIASTSPRLNTNYNDPASGLSPQPMFLTDIMGSPVSSVPTPDPQMQGIDIMPQQVPFVQGSYQMDQPQPYSLMTPTLHQRSLSTGDIYGAPANGNVAPSNRTLGGARAFGVPPQVFTHVSINVAEVGITIGPTKWIVILTYLCF